MPEVRVPWTRREIERVYQLYPVVKEAIHERNKAIIQLANELGRGVRAVEAQLLMFRSLERGNYAWDRMSALVREVWDQQRGASGVAGLQTQVGDAMLGLERLQQRAFGGEDVATRPDHADEDWWPKGPMHVGVDVLIDRAVVACNQGSGLAVFLLLGGPGNGKSFAARALLERLGVCVGHEESLASRAYHISLPRCDLVVLNDATIALTDEYGDDYGIALATDLDRWVRDSNARPIVVFGCVNRGIVIDELHALEMRADAQSEGSRILRWLAGQGVPDGSGLAFEGGGGDSVDARYRRLASREGSQSVQVDALSVDVSSLLEEWPGAPSLDALVAGGAMPPRRRVDDPRGGTPAGKLVMQVLALLEAEADMRPEVCPLRANYNGLAADGGKALLGFLRAAEIAGGRLASFRDFWGMIALAIAGPRLPAGSSGSVGRVDGLLAGLVEQGNQARFKSLASLSISRTHQALFLAVPPVKFCAQQPPGFPFAGALAKVDPVYSRHGIASAVEEAMGEVPLERPPSDSLLAAIPSLAAYWSPFEEALEAALLALLIEGKEDDVEVRRLLGWYGGYLLRFATFHSVLPGRKDVLDAWTDCIATTSGGHAPLPFSTEKALESLLFPSIPQVVHAVNVRAWAPSSQPIRGLDGLDDVLLDSYDIRSVRLMARLHGEKLFLDAVSGPSSERMASTSLDFDLLREALVLDASGRGGTEISPTVEARIERFRSSVLSRMPASAKRVLLAMDGHVQQLG